MTDEQKAEHNRLTEKAKDCAVFYGIYSKEYAIAVHAMNDYWLQFNPKPISFKENVMYYRNKFMTKWLHKKL